ncbi:DgyrCDS6106 [Dimorphilus gyrociliatus]|uniref:DgyrCDS6106 n=1 Tax=Dimorphilus gyrociliatus TaxID=2664684 RepID=A0A7I8VMT4_9ANNE|nr:DgyrCDS6106 [Dimorphilus gyrociliatus]
MSPPFLPGQISIEQIIDSRKPDPEEMLENLGFGSSEDNDDIKKRLPPRFHQTDVIESPTPVELDNDPGLFGFESYKHFYEKIAQASLPHRFIDPNHELIKGFIERRLSENKNCQSEQLKNLQSLPSTSSNLTLTPEGWRSYEDVLDFTNIAGAEASNIEENTSLVRSVKRTSKKGKTFESILHPLNAEYLASVGYYDSTSSGSPSPTNIIPPLLKNYQQQSFDLEEIDSVHERSKLTRDPSMQSEQSSGFIDSQEFSREPFAKPETEIIEACNTQVLENKKTNKIRVSSSFEKKKDFQSIIHSTIKSYSNQLESIHQRWKNLCTKVQDDVDLSKEFKDLDSIKEKIREQIRLCESLLRKDVNDECIPICVALLKEQIYEASILATFEGCTISENKECLDVLKDLTCLESGQTSSYTVCI